MGEWDLCGPEIILIEAGGKMTDVEGKELQYNKKNSKMTRGVAASNGKFHQKIIESIKNSK
jgi:3'(2'), 5'-bisphosphate nucleotidase